MHQSNSQTYRKNVTQLPPIDKKGAVEVLDQHTRSPRQSHVLSPIMNSNHNDTMFPDATRINMQVH